MGGYAWVTLATNNAYSLGALVLAHSLKKTNTPHKLAVLITPAVSESMREQLQTVFDVVKVVDVLDSKDEAHLALMKRPDLGITFTKIHCWRLIEFEKCVFLDADTLVVRNCDELFEREEFSAAPDVSWPDCFNSGVFVYRPSIETFNKLLQFAVENRSFDGGDQGLLNQYFSDWATEDIKKHLPFVYNLTSVAVYSYIPAFKHYGAETRIVHFIGTGKPWLQQVDVATKTVAPSSGSEHLTPLLQQWWDLFCEKVHPKLDKNLESSNNGMSHSHVEACSNPLPVALIDETQTPHLIEPCTPYREKDDFRQYNLPYQPFDVKGSSGELLNEEFLLASVVSPKALEISLDEQQRHDENKMEEKSKTDYGEEEIKKKDEVVESNICMNEKNFMLQELRTSDEEKKVNEENKANEEKNPDEENKTEDEARNLEQQQKQEDPPPPKNPFEYSSFFPDDACINNYLEKNVKTYQPFDNHRHHHNHHHHHKQYKNLDEHNIGSDSSKDAQEIEENVSVLPRFLTLPEDDRRQSGNIQTHSPEKDRQPENKLLQEDFPTENHKHFTEEPIPSRNEINAEPITEKRELTKSKSMPYLLCGATIAESPPPPPPPRSIWKSQPDVNIDFNRRYTMPKLKPILPKQNSFSKSTPSGMPKVTQYTEFLMSSDYKEPIHLPKDKVGFVEMHIRKEANLRRSKSDVDIQSKFGPLPYALSPEAKKEVIPKKIPFRHLENELYDLTQCKRQLGNKPKPKDTEKRKENICSLPALKPIVPAKDINSTFAKKRKSKKLLPGEGGREKILKQDPNVSRERTRVRKSTSRNVTMNTNRNDLDEILNRLREYSKNYQHFFGLMTETDKKEVTCKNATVQVNEQNGECISSEIFKTFRTPVKMSSKESQTKNETTCESSVESSEFRQFRNYVRNQRGASQRGLLGLQEILSESVQKKKDSLKFSSSEVEKKEMESGSDSLVEIKKATKEKDETSKLEKEYSSLKARDVFIQPPQEYCKYQNSSKSCENEYNDRTQIKPSMLKNIESSTSAKIISNPRGCSNSSRGSKVVSSLNRTKDIPFDLSGLLESSEVKTNGIIEKTVQSHSKPYVVIPSFTYKTKEKAESSEIVSSHFEVEKEQQASDKEEANISLKNKTSVECNKNSKGSFRKKSIENRKKTNGEEAALGQVKECQSVDENGFPVAASDVMASENFTKSKVVIEAKLHQEDFSDTELQKQKGEERCISGKHCNVKSKEFVVPSENKKINSERLGVISELKDKKSTEGDTGVSTRSNKQCDEDSNGTLNQNAATEAIAPIVSSLTTLRKEQGGHVIPSGVKKTKDESKKKKDEMSEEENNIKSFSFTTTKDKVPECCEKSEDLCLSAVPETRSNRSREKQVSSTAEVTASDLVEEMITKAVCESGNQSRSAGPPRTSPSAPPQKFRNSRKPRSSPKKISQNGFKTRFDVPSNDSPDETTRFAAKKAYDKKSKKKPPPSACTPNSGNTQSENLEDLRSTSGIAGAIAQLNLESGNDQSPESTAASAAHQEYLRRQNWETGNMDYMGKDSFDNIWSKICQTIETKESEKPVAGSPRPPAETSAITEETEKLKEVALAGSTVSLSSDLQKCPKYIETLPGEPAVGPIEDDEIFFSKPAKNQTCLTNVAEEVEVEIEDSANRAPLPMAEFVKLSDILHPEASNPQTGSSEACDKQQDIMMKVKESEKDKSQIKEEKVEKVPPGEKSKSLPETLAIMPKCEKPSAPSAEEKPQLAALPTEIKSQPSSPDKPECKTVAICQPSISLPQAPPSDEQQQQQQQQQPESLVRATEPEKKAEECKTVAIPSPPVVSPGAPLTKKEKRQSNTGKVEKKSDVKSEPIPLPPPVSPDVLPSQEVAISTSNSDSLKDENKQKKGVFTKILEMVGVAPKEKNGSEISQSVFYDTEEGAFLKQKEINDQTPVMTENVQVSGDQGSGEKVEAAQLGSDPQVIEEADELKAKEAKQEGAMPPAESHKAKELPISEPEEKKTDIIPELKELKATQETKLQELKHSDKTQEQKPPTKETEKSSATEKSKNQSKKQKPKREKSARNSSPKELKTSADSTQASVPKRKSPSPKLTMPQNLPETEITMPTPPPHPEISPRRNSALLKVDDSILETPPVPEPPKENVEEAIKGKASKEIDIMEKAKGEVEDLLKECRSAESELGENSDLINTMKLMVAGEQSVKAAEEVIEELRVTSEEERKQHKGEAVSSKLSDQILKAIPPPRRKAISEASASTSAIPKASSAPEQKNPPGENKTKTSKSSSIPVPPPRSRGKPTQPPPSKSKGKK